MLVKIKRQENATSKPYWQSFVYNGDLNVPVSAMLDTLNYEDDLFDAEGKPARRIRWECSCLQKMCGACAMIINNVPSLACETFLNTLKGDEIVLEPLSKFPVVSDLVVDRSVISENLKNAGTYLGDYKKLRPKDYPQLYSAARCLKCGLCLEVCPNYKKNELIIKDENGEMSVKGGDFYGATFANESYLMATQSQSRSKEIRKEFNKHFADNCSKAFACMEVCPMSIDTLSSISRMHRGK